MDMWTTLHALPEGAVFETEDGIRAVKSEYRYPSGGIECVLLASGEYANFAQDVADPEASARAHNATRVRPLQVAPPTDAAALVTEDELAEVERLYLDHVKNGKPFYAHNGGPQIVAERGIYLARKLAAEVRRLTAALDAAHVERDRVGAIGEPLHEVIRDLDAQGREEATARKEALRERDAARVELAERDAQIARIAVESDATEAAMREQVEAAEKLAADLRAKAWALLCARTLVAGEGGIITGCSTTALLAYNGAAVDLATAVGKAADR